MRVAMVSEHASPLAALGGVDAGGQNVHVGALATQLGARGVEVVVHTRRDEPGLPRRSPLAPRVMVDHVPAGPPRPVGKDDLPPFMNDFAAELARLWARERPDVVHAHFWMSGRAALAAARPLGIPVVQTFHALGVVKRRHQGAADTSPPGRVEAERAIAIEADHIVATCSDELFELVRLGADPSRISVVPCGVDLDHFSPDGPCAPRAPRPHRVLSVGRLVERKGLDTLLAALAHLPDTELVVAGGPALAGLDLDPDVSRLRSQARRAEVADRVRFLGRVGRAELPALVRSADVVASVPWYEPFGMVPLEAMACAVPVVASGVGGLVDTVVDGVTGLLVPPRDAGALAEALAGLLADPALRATLGHAGARRARARYGWPKVAVTTLGAYARAMAHASGEPAASRPTRRHRQRMRTLR